MSALPDHSTVILERMAPDCLGNDVGHVAVNISSRSPISLYEIIVTPELRQRAVYFEYFAVGEKVSVPDRWYVRDVLTLTPEELVKFAATEFKTMNFFHYTQYLITTANYFNHSATSLIVAELVWVLGRSPDLWSKCFKKAGDTSFIIRRLSHKKSRGYQQHGHRFWEYNCQTTPIYEVRSDLEGALYQALKTCYPMPFVGVAEGLRKGIYVDSNVVAYFGNLRMTKWYNETKGGLGACFSLNTINKQCLEYAVSVSTPITRHSIHNSDVSCKEFLIENGGVFDRVHSDRAYASDVTFNPSIIRADLEALDSFVAVHGQKCFTLEQLLLSCTNISTFNFVAAHCDVDVSLRLSNVRWPDHPGLYHAMRTMLDNTACNISDELRTFLS